MILSKEPEARFYNYNHLILSYIKYVIARNEATLTMQIRKQKYRGDQTAAARSYRIKVR